MAEVFDENAQRAKVAGGLKGGPFFNNPVKFPPLTFTDGVDPLVKQKFAVKEFAQPAPKDTWFGKRN